MNKLMLFESLNVNLDWTCDTGYKRGVEAHQ